MKKILLTIAAFVALTPAASFAVDGTVTLNGIVKPATCSITTNNIVIPLTTSAGIPQQTFTGIGTTSAWAAGNNLVLDCRGVNANVYIGLTDASNPSNTTDKLALTATSTATGIGVQVNIVSNGNQLVTFGPDTSTPGRSNQILLAGTTEQAAVQYVIQGRYIQTAATIKSGTANAAATFTLAYQ